MFRHARLSSSLQRVLTRKRAVSREDARVRKVCSRGTAAVMCVQACKAEQQAPAGAHQEEGCLQGGR